MLLLNVSTFLAIVAGSFAVGLAAIPARRLLRRARSSSPSGNPPMPSTTRIYVTTEKATGAERLVETTHGDRALRHIVETTHTVRVASQQDLVKALAAGVKVETPGAAPASSGA